MYRTFETLRFPPNNHRERGAVLALASFWQEASETKHSGVLALSIPSPYKTVAQRVISWPRHDFVFFSFLFMHSPDRLSVADAFPKCISYTADQVLPELLLREGPLVAPAKNPACCLSPLSHLLITDEQRVWSQRRGRIMRKGSRMVPRIGRSDEAPDPGAFHHREACRAITVLTTQEGELGHS